MTKVHIGHSTATGAMCGMGSKFSTNDITVSERAFFREVAKRHRCRYCILLQYPYGFGDPERLDAVLDED